MVRRAPFTRIGRARLVLALLLPAAIASVWIAWLQRDALLDWITGPEPVVAAPPTEPDLAVAVDSATLIEACRRALIDYPPWLPAWRIESLACTARLEDPELVALRPELEGPRGVAGALAAWPGPCRAPAPATRRAAHLTRWYTASVVDARAWAVVPLGLVLRVVEIAPPLFLAFRRAVDREFGIRGARIGYARGPARRLDRPDRPSRPVVPIPPIYSKRPLASPVFEITGLDRGAGGGWRLHGRPLAPAGDDACGIPRGGPRPGKPFQTISN